ncbi:TIGR01777 family oxidoreductase [Bordetella sp. FB-8]|uniref:TIGR01777 family oxidoreductase n=1 Tax=Bordetella sp. FB-8 TaxID=1159870 RepID=UPI00037F33CF|nr:TIGR01777 family oxidoreductase [Bordetella sp. FB-8]
MKILLTGGTGLIGRALCRRWAGDGHHLIVWSRRPKEVPALCSGARGVARLEEIDDVDTPDAVVNLAGAPIADRPWSAARKKLLWDSRVALTRELVQWLGCLPLPPRVLLSGSAAGWYGDRGEQSIDETDTTGGSPGDFGSRLCAAWEDEARRAQTAHTRVVLLRTASVLAAQGGMLARLRLPFRLGLGGRLGSGRQWLPWIHLDDATGLIDFLLEHEDCRGPYNICAPRSVRNADFTRALAASLRRPACLPVPAWALRLGLGEMSGLLLGGQRLLARRADEAGYRFQFPDLDAALRDLAGRSLHPPCA